MQKHLRNVLSRLMPDVLLDLGLPGAVDALVHFWKARKPEVDFQAEVTHESLDDRVAAVTFRVVQESLSNSLRHAEPAMVTVIVKHTPSGVNIEITDDGKGLPDKMPPSGLGLLGMRERVRSIGGMFEVGNRNGHAGVSVRAFLHHDSNLSSAVRKLLIVDDHLVVREGLRRLLSSSIEAICSKPVPPKLRNAFQG